MSSIGSTAGTNRARKTLTLTTGTDTGPFLLEAKGFTHWHVSLWASGTVTGGSVTVYGADDEATCGILLDFNPQPGYVKPTFTSDGLWFPLIPKATDTEAVGTIANPITAFDGSQQMLYDGLLYAMRLVANAYAGGGSIIAKCSATD